MMNLSMVDLYRESSVKTLIFVSSEECVVFARRTSVIG